MNGIYKIAEKKTIDGSCHCLQICGLWFDATQMEAGTCHTPEYTQYKYFISFLTHLKCTFCMQNMILFIKYRDKRSDALSIMEIFINVFWTLGRGSISTRRLLRWKGHPKILLGILLNHEIKLKSET